MSEHPATDLFGFLQSWYGPANRSPESGEITGVPAPLCAWYGAEEAWSRRLATQNMILRASELVIEDGLTLFYVENQGVWHWAYGPGDDPQVFDRENEPGVSWSPAGASLSDFLVHAAMFEAIWGSPLGATALDIDQAHFERIVSPLGRVSMTPWHWPAGESRLYTGARILAWATVWPTPITVESAYHVYVAAKSNDDLAYLDDLNIRWGYNSRKFGEGVYC